ncbi:hypothetical protein E2C01_097156 [Portunus trituberculatus]|uniref:Uncharacterized protein n=1 Tax=Portunus trituberculatus TaxID=210409 RepID=A0A5B7JUG4_PORTR|nr:hypothetical protein [Portunus trituberculatus]
MLSVNFFASPRYVHNTWPHGVKAPTVTKEGHNALSIPQKEKLNRDNVLKLNNSVSRLGDDMQHLAHFQPVTPRAWRGGLLGYSPESCLGLPWSPVVESPITARGSRDVIGSGFGEWLLAGCVLLQLALSPSKSLNPAM